MAAPIGCQICEPGQQMGCVAVYELPYTRTCPGMSLRLPRDVRLPQKDLLDVLNGQRKRGELCDVVLVSLTFSITVTCLKH